MQAPTTSQRSTQRRSPATADPGPPPSVPARSISPGPSIQSSRSSTASAKAVPNGSTGSRRQNGGLPSQSSQTAPPLSQIEKSVTHLLVATKQLLETLTQWSRHQATDAQVSDVYVRLGYEFNIACRAFTAINVDTSDLGNVPELLRNILESTLSQEASVESLEKYLPRIRDIIINLLHGLKRKQQKLRQKSSRDGTSQNGEAPIPRNSSVSSVGSANTGLTTLLDQGISNNFRGDGGNSAGEAGVPPRMSSASNPRRGIPPRDQSRGSLSSDQSTLSSTTMQSMPVLPPYPGDEVPMPEMPGSVELSMDDFPPPPPPPKQQNALAALQRGGDLERRASRRYSAYQISKHLGASPNGVPMLPPAQNSPIPNRGRNDARESMRAVQNRGDQRHIRQPSTRLANEVSPARVPSRISEEIAPAGSQTDDSSTVKPPEDKIVDFDAPSATLKGPLSDALPVQPTSSDAESTQAAATVSRQSPPYGSQERQFTPELSPPPGQELTVFLQYKTKVKKFVFPEGYTDLSMARLQLAFIEKFAWNTHSNGVDLPEIYLQDPISGVRHELEDLRDIKDRSVLVLNVEALDEVKRHFDEGLGGIKRIVEGVRYDLQRDIQRVSDRQADAAKEMARLALAPSKASMASFSKKQQKEGSLVSSSKVVDAHSEIQSLRLDAAVIRQMMSGVESDIRKELNGFLSMADNVTAMAIQAAIPDIESGSGRSYVVAGRKILTADSDHLVATVDDLQDMVEDLRKDVVLRGVRPLPRQLEDAAKGIAQATMELKKMQEYLKRERPIWTKIWEKELQIVCNDREEVTMQEDLATDLEDDLLKATQTFALVEEATKQQMADVPGATTPRSISRGLNHVRAADPTLAKEGLLGEVRALRPNHQNRLDAIERAERLRQKELENRRGGEFQKELGNFVEEGKLKKAGGFEEVERARKLKDERIRKEVWERQNGMTQADALAEASEEPLDGEDAPEEDGGLLPEETPADI